jgi:predicted enzyme related to lactoylglutathione lyase
MGTPAVAWFEVTGKDGAALQKFYGDPAAYLQKAEGLGGQTIVPPTEIEQFGLTFAFFADPEGHVVGLSKGAVQ